jgi:LCP family protein required for cell wall assembly
MLFLGHNMIFSTTTHQPAGRASSRTLSGSVWWRILLTLFAITLIFGGWFLWKTHTTAQKISLRNSGNSPWKTLNGFVSNETNPGHGITSLHQDDQDIINILLLGIAGEHKPGNLLTDTIIVLRIDTKNHRAGLLSLPRDLLVPVGDSTASAKINSLYPISDREGKGVDYTKQAVTLVTGLPIHYFVVANFDGFQQAIDAIGGVNVFVERDLLDTRYPGPNYSYETFSISRGWHTLDGATALKYARERHNDPEGDFGRAKRQQNILQTVKDKILSAKTLANPFALNQLLTTLGDNVRTDIAPEDIPAMLEVAKSIDTRTLNTAVIDAWKSESLLKVSHIPTESGMMFALVPRTGNWNETRDLGANLFDLDNLRRHEAAIQTEQPSIAIVNASGHADYASRFHQLLTDQMNFKTVQASPATQKTIEAHSTLIDVTAGQKPWSADALLKKFPLSLDNTSKSPLKTDFIITLGQDMQSVFQYDDASREEYQQQADTMENN